ncbi:MAG: hypothetical protein JW727_06105 [Candidatus Aenigmarchaeota archaeon]|nr:hypothetical protein [Candidatus Aenigmarchaeota archaeon]
MKRYDASCRFEGEVPSHLAEMLPLFGSRNGDAYTNSGGRGAIITSPGRKNSEECYRIKGADPFGFTTKLVSDSDKNRIDFVNIARSSIPDKTLSERVILNGGDYPFCLDNRNLPFNFLNLTSAHWEETALQDLSKKYENWGLTHPCQYVGRIVYDKVLWQGSPVSTMIFLIPNAGSDLREEEIMSQIWRELFRAPYDKLEKYGGMVMDFYEKLLRGHGFECKLMNDCGINPSIGSNRMQNYVLGNVSKGEIGLSRIDHELSEKKGSAALTSCIFPVVPDIKSCMAQLSLATQSLELDEGSSIPDMGPFPSGGKCYYTAEQCYVDGEPNRRVEITPHTKKLIRDTDRIFFEAYRTGSPEPIKETELIRLCEALNII